MLAPAVAQETKTSPVTTQKNVELTLYMLIGLPQASQPDNVPKELEGVITQLKGLFTYKGFRTFDTIILRGREGSNSRVNGAAALPGGPTDSAQLSDYTANVERLRVTQDEKGNLVRIDYLNVSVRIPYRSLAAQMVSDGRGGTVERQPAGHWTSRNISFNTNIDVREGQKVVVGKANIDGAGNALILVVTAKVID
jgi:ribosomal 50S subunit-recycling heat shock protein